MSSVGVAFSVAILVIGMFMLDGVELMMDLQFRVGQREDLAVSFNRDLGPEARHDLERIPGVTRVEPYQNVMARIRSGHRKREVTITGLEADGQLRLIVSENRRIHPVPLEGLVLSEILAERLGVTHGDTLMVQALTGLRRTKNIPVQDVVKDLIGTSAYMNVEALRKLTLEVPRLSGAFLLTDPARVGDVNAELKRAPAVASVVSPMTMFESFESQLEDTLFIAVFFLIGFAMLISVAVIYNGTRIALSERGRELASLRVLGFSKSEIATLLFGEQAIVTVIAIPFGWVIGYGLAYLLVTGMASETYRIPLIVSTQTYLWTAIITIAAAWGSGLLVHRRLNQMDLIAVLKTRE